MKAVTQRKVIFLKVLAVMIIATLFLLVYILNYNNSLRFNKITAIYWSLKAGGQLSKSDLSSHKQVLPVYTFEQLKDDVNSSNHPLEIWIDKNALAKITISDFNWLIKKGQDHYVFALVGFNNSLYSFRDKLGLYGMQGPAVDWSKINIQPGFSLAMHTDGPIHFKTYNGIPTCGRILSYASFLKAHANQST